MHLLFKRASFCSAGPLSNKVLCAALFRQNTGSLHPSYELQDQHFLTSLCDTGISVPPLNSQIIARKTDGIRNNPKKEEDSCFFFKCLCLLGSCSWRRICWQLQKSPLSWSPKQAVHIHGNWGFAPEGRKLIVSMILPEIIFFIWLLFDCSFGISEQMLKLYSGIALTAHSN